MKTKPCDRCGSIYNVRGGYEFVDCFGEKVKMCLCWNCDFDIINGGDPFRDILDILDDRRENNLINF